MNQFCINHICFYSKENHKKLVKKKKGKPQLNILKTTKIKDKSSLNFKNPKKKKTNLA